MSGGEPSGSSSSSGQPPPPTPLQPAPAGCSSGRSGGGGGVDPGMLKFLTHKLRTHSLNEEPGANPDKADDDHDSGTESDDEFQNGGDVADELSTEMDSPANLDDSGAARDSAATSDADLGASPRSTTTTPLIMSNCSSGPHLQRLPSGSSGCSSTETPPIEHSYDFLLRLSNADQHSSEEELEVINGPRELLKNHNRSGGDDQFNLESGRASTLPTQSCNRDTPGMTNTSSTTPNDGCSSQLSRHTPGLGLSRPGLAQPEKRKWSEANSGCGNHKNSSCGGSNSDREAKGTAYSAPVSRVGREPGSSGSSDEEVNGLCYSRSGSAISQPVQFRSSPPVDAHKPVRSLSPPPKLFHASSSACLATASTSSSSSSSSQLLLHHHQHHHHHHHHHRPRSRPRPHSHYHSHSSLEQQQLAADLDVVGACSPRKRHRPPHKLARPCLDFEKMQQMKTQAVTAWRHPSDHGNEMSVFCW